MNPDGKRAPRNRTLCLQPEERERLQARLVTWTWGMSLESLSGRTVLGDCLEICRGLPDASFPLIVADPPYNLDKKFGDSNFSRSCAADYEEWLEAWIPEVARLLTEDGTLYVCSEWRSSGSVQAACERHLKVRNRITWEREKGRGAAANWKNCSEDIWFCTKSNRYHFDAEAVRLKRRVLAPYREHDGAPRGWSPEGQDGFRLTAPSNLWNDLTVPFWSMPENTDHPTQKPEKLMAKLILASSRPGDLVLDPFLGSGTTSVVARKLGRRYVGIERELEYCLLAEKRLDLAAQDASIQGYTDGVFWERNSGSVRKGSRVAGTVPSQLPLEYPA